MEPKIEKPKTTFVLTMLGTDTNYSPEPTTEYPKGESLSVISKGIKTDKDKIQVNHEQPALQKKDTYKLDEEVSTFAPLKEGISSATSFITDTFSAVYSKASYNTDAIAYKTDDVQVINGPGTMGREVNHRIGKGVAALFGAISRGQTEINIIGHSRGAVESVLIAHEINDVKALIKNCSNKKELIALMSKAHDERVKTQGSNYNTGSIISSLQEELTDDKFSEEDFENLKKNLEGDAVSINMFLIDPVPGDATTNEHLNVVTWYDDRFYELPPIVKDAKIAYYNNEHSYYGFSPAFINKSQNAQNQTVEYIALPGNHGTGTSGKNTTQQGQACRHFLRNLPGRPSPRKGQKKATSMPPAALAVLVPLDFQPPTGLKICAPQ